MENVENIYPLSPMQQGMLFHSLFEPSAGLYIELLAARLTGPLDVPLFQTDLAKDNRPPPNSANCFRLRKCKGTSAGSL